MSSGRYSTARSSWPRALQRLHQALLEAEILQPAPLRRARAPASADNCCAAPARATSSVISASSLLRASSESVPSRTGSVERDLDVDLDVGGVDAGRIVDRVGVEPHAAQRRLDAAALGHAEIGALADHLARAARAPVMRIAIVGAVADLIVGLARGADIGADAAEPQQIDVAACRIAVITCCGVAFSPSRPSSVARLRRSARSPSRCARRCRRRPRDQRLVVVLPARARQIEQPLRARRSCVSGSGSGSMKMSR